MKPKEYDTVRLLRPMPEYGLPVGSKGAVVMDLTRYSKADLPAAYEVEFVDASGVTQALVTVLADDLEVVSRADAGNDPS